MSKNTPAPSFMKAAFMGDIAEESVFPYPEVSPERKEEIRLIADSIQRLGEMSVDSAAIDKESKIPPDVLKEMAEAGLMGLNAPEEYGGLGLNQTSYARVCEELVALDRSITVTLLAHQSIGLKALSLVGNNAQKKKYLPKLASGEWLAGFALTEPSSGSDAYSIKTRAKLSDDGSHYILNGSKQWITNGGIGDFFTVFAKTREPAAPDGKSKKRKERITAFIVTRDMEGFSHGIEEDKLGIKGSSTTSLFFDNIKVPAANVLGEPGRGFKLAMAILNYGRLGLGAGAVGGLKQLVKLSSEHASQRKQFGRPIADFGLIQEKIGKMTLDTFVTESMVYLTTGMADRGDEDWSIEAAICKIYGSDALLDAANEALQIAGGMGYMTHAPYEAMLRDARIQTIFEGTNEILRCFVALSGMKGVGDYLKVIGNALNDPIKGFGLLVSELVVRKVSRSIYGDKISLAHPELKREAALIEDHVRHLNAETEKSVRKYRKDILNRQFIQKRLAEVAIHLYAMTAVVSRTSATLAQNNAAGSEQQVLMCKAFGEKASTIIKTHLDDMNDNIDEGLKAFSRYSCEKGGYGFDIL